MADIVSSEKRSQMMAGIKGKNTRPEIAIRKLLHANGYRFRLHKKELPGKPDIVLPKYRIAIFVHGCFWHGHNNCSLFRLPKSKTDFWRQKIEGNVQRDQSNQKKLLDFNWRVLQIWECALKGKHKLSDHDLIEKIIKFTNEKNDTFDIRGDSIVSNRLR